MRKVGLAQLIVFIYFCVCGGPWGIEAAIHHGGPGTALVVFLVLPWIWAIPVGLLTAELASALPVNGGYIVWVSRAFGNFAGFLEGYSAWVSDIFDNSVYPVLFSTYLERAVAQIAADPDKHGHYPAMFSHQQRFFVRFGCLSVCTLANLLGFKTLGCFSAAMLVVTLLPFLIFVVVGIPHWQPDTWFVFPSDVEIHWGVLLSTIMWATDGYDAPAALAGSVAEPSKNYPRAVFCVCIISLLTVLLPIITALSFMPDFHQWSAKTGIWAHVADMVGGPALRWMVTFSGVFSNMAMFVVLLNTSSWCLYALALPGLLDIPFLTQLSHSFHQPSASILINAIIVSFCISYDFAFLVQIDVSLNCFNLLLGDFALIWLRIKEPDLPRPFKICGGLPGVLFVIVPHIAICLVQMAVVDKEAQLVAVSAMIFGCVIWVVCRCLSNRRTRLLNSTLAAKGAREGELLPLTMDVDLEEVLDDIPLALEERHRETESILGLGIFHSPKVVAMASPGGLQTEVDLFALTGEYPATPRATIATIEEHAEVLGLRGTRKLTSSSLVPYSSDNNEGGEERGMRRSRRRRTASRYSGYRDSRGSRESEDEGDASEMSSLLTSVRPSYQSTT